MVGARCPLANEAAVRAALILFENATPLSDAHVDRTRGPCTGRWPRQVRGDGSMTVHEAAYSAFTAYWGVAPQRIGSALRACLVLGRYPQGGTLKEVPLGRYPWGGTLGEVPLGRYP